VKDRVSHPYTTSGKIIADRETKYSIRKGSRHSVRVERLPKLSLLGRSLAKYQLLSDNLVLASSVMSRHTSVPLTTLCIKVTKAALHVTNNYQIIQYRYYKLLHVVGPSGPLFNDAVSTWTISCQGLCRVNCRWMSMSIGGNIRTVLNRSTWREYCRNVTLPTTNLARIILQLKKGLHSEVTSQQ
jgi:hypothetical protein